MPQFKYKLSEIELTMRKLGANVIFIPKGYCEIARRDAEYI